MLRYIFGREKWGRKNFETLLQNLSEGILVQDLKGNIIYFNDAFGSIFGFENQNDVLKCRNAKKLFSLFKIRDELGNVVLPQKLSGKNFSKLKKETRIVLHLKNKKGKDFWVRVRSNPFINEEGEMDYYVGVFRDITERKLIEEEGMLRTKLLEAQSQATTQGILAVDKNQKVIYVNSRLAQLLDVQYPKIQKTDVESLFEIGKKTFIDFDKFIGKAKALGKSKTRKGKGLLVAKNGRAINYYTVTVNDDKEHFMARMWFFDDKTNDYKTEEQRNTFMGIVTHELKTPLTTIKGYAEILNKKVDISDFKKVRDYTERIIQGAEKLTELVDDLLDITQMRSGALKLKKKQVNIDELLNDVLMNFKRLNTHNIHKSGKANKNISIDKIRITQVLNNLMNNAVKYTPVGSNIKVSIKQDLTTTTIAIKDSGPGISDSDKERIFQIYVRGKNRNKVSGFGIGLFVSQTIIKGHGGKMWVESRPGKGAHFIFTLPNKAIISSKTQLLPFV